MNKLKRKQKNKDKIFQVIISNTLRKQVYKRDITSILEGQIDLKYLTTNIKL